MRRPSQAQITHEWMDKTDKFLNHAFKEAKGVRVTSVPVANVKTRKVFSIFLYTPYIFILSLMCNVLSFL